MKEQRFREQQDLADSLALKDRLQDNKSETSSLALAGDEGEGHDKDEEAAAIARAAEDGSKSPASREDAQAEAEGHNKDTAQQHAGSAVEEGGYNKVTAASGAEDNRPPSGLTAAATTETTVGSSDHQQHQQQQQQQPPSPQEPSQRAAAVHLMLGHRRSDGYTFAASLDSELAPPPSTSSGAPSSSSSAAAATALALAPAVALPSSEVPDWHGVAQMTLVRADGLPSYAELYVHDDQSAPSIGRPTLGRWLSLLGLCQYAPVIEKNFGYYSTIHLHA